MFFERIHDKFGRIRKDFGFVREKFEFLQKIFEFAGKKFKFLYGRFSQMPSELKYSSQKTKIDFIGAKIKYLCRKKGTAVLEAALCVPVLLYLMFFTLEAIRIGIYQVAVDNMALKLAFEYSGLKSSTNFEKVINDSKPAFFKSMDGIYCRVYVFSDLNTLVKSTQMNEAPQWENTSNLSIRNPDGTVLNSEATSGCAFIVTVSYKFPFSSAFIKKLFAGGKNYGDNFLLWGRAINVCS